MSEIKIFTAHTLDGIKIFEYKGLVTAKNVRAVNILKDFFTSFRDIVGGRSASYQGIMDEMEKEVIDEIKNNAKNMGANAIIAFDVDFDNVGSKDKSLIMAFAKGTAVVIE